MDLKDFTRRCRTIAQFHSHSVEFNELPLVLRGNVDNNLKYRFEYEDDTILIRTGRRNWALTVDMKQPHSNPVLIIAKDGNIVRTHGERYMLHDHINALMSVIAENRYEDDIEFAAFLNWIPADSFRKPPKRNAVESHTVLLKIAKPPTLLFGYYDYYAESFVRYGSSEFERQYNGDLIIDPVNLSPTHWLLVTDEKGRFLDDIPKH